MANSNGWGDGAANNSIGWGQGANNAIAWGDSHAKSWAGATDIVGLTTDPAASAYFASTGITGATQQTAIDNLVKGLKQDGLWSKMKAVYPFVTDNRNLLGYTEDFSNAYWGKLNSTITSNSITAPNGTLTADTFTGTSATSYIYTNTPISSIGNNTFSIYVKAGSLTSFSLDFATSALSYGGTSIINLITGTAGAITYYGGASGWTVSVEAVSNGWYRCSIGGNIATTQNMFCEILAASGTLYLWGAQLEKSATATTYQPIATTQQAFISSQFKYNLVNPVDSDAAFRLVFNGGWTHSANGATPNGTNGYADTRLVANSAMNFNNQSFSDYLGTNPAASTVCQFGSFGGTPFSGVSLFVRDGYNGMNDNILSPTMTTSTQAGLFTLNRNNANTKKLFRNGSSISSISSTATNLSNGSIFIGTANVNSNPNYYSTAQHRFFSAGDGLTDTEASNLYTRVQAFQTALSRQV